MPREEATSTMAFEVGISHKREKKRCGVLMVRKFLLIPTYGKHLAVVFPSNKTGTFFAGTFFSRRVKVRESYVEN